MSSCGSESYGSLVVREAHNWACLVRAADEARNGHTGEAVDGPGSLLNYQGHPLDRLTPDRDVTNPAPTLKKTVPTTILVETRCRPVIGAIRRCIRR